MACENNKLLVVDDDSRLRDLLSKFLTDKGFNITTSSNAKEATSNLYEEDFDLIILDVMMPQESGLELAKKLRKS